MKNKKLIIGAVGVVLIGSYFVYKYFTKNKVYQGTGNFSSNNEEEIVKDIKLSPPIASNTNLDTNSSFPLKNGSKGKQVAVLQKWLNDNGYASPKLVVDGVFGSKTESAVRKMQQFPNQKQILDYNTFNASFLMGQVTSAFYDMFVIKVKPVPKSNNIFGL